MKTIKNEESNNCCGSVNTWMQANDINIPKMRPLQKPNDWKPAYGFISSVSRD